MSGEGTPPDYDFSLDGAAELSHFDAERIAEQAIWPTVDHLSRRDWRQEALLSHGKFWFPATGSHDGKTYDVGLEANCYRLERLDNDYIVLGHRAVLCVSSDAGEDLSDVIFHHAEQANPDLMEMMEKNGKLVARLGVTYSFDTEEAPDISAFQSIVDLDADGSVLWTSERLDETEIEEELTDGEDVEVEEVVFDTDKFHFHDVEKIATALSILGAPEQCLRALNIIKGQPIEVEDSVD